MASAVSMHEVMGRRLAHGTGSRNSSSRKSARIKQPITEIRRAADAAR
ncbi:hypothetical protein QQM39_43015 [Streptomyces sp. DT2A-34]|nr:hypothetical protein [Streptomyces sp. DT2A-34]MDO0917334.1 hypothetical protein [Streptomyces sp. DT2A-34]